MKLARLTSVVTIKAETSSGSESDTLLDDPKARSALLHRTMQFLKYTIFAATSCSIEIEQAVVLAENKATKNKRLVTRNLYVSIRHHHLSNNRRGSTHNEKQS